MSSEGVPVIEFTGCPGAGKTTAAGELMQILRERGLGAVSMIEAARPHAVRTPAGRVLGSLPATWSGPLLWQVYRWYGWRGARAFRREQTALAALASGADRHTATWFFRLAGRLRFLSRSPLPGEIVVVDDGFLHRAVALHASAAAHPDLDAVRAYVDLLQAPAIAVHVRASATVCAARVRSRGLWRHRDGWTDDDLERYLGNAAQVVDAAVARARARGWTMVDVENEHDGAGRMRDALLAAADRLRPADAVTGGAA